MEWNIVKLECYPEKDGQTDVVFTVHWELTATEDKYFGRVYGSVNLTLDAESSFTPFNKLTKEQVVSWVKDALGEETVTDKESNVLQQIAKQKSPTIVTLSPPWAPAQELIIVEEPAA